MSRRRTAPHFGRLAPPHLAARTLRLLVRLGTTLLLGVAILAARTTAASPIPLQETASNAGSSISGGEKGNESSLPPEVIDALIAEMRSLIAVEMEQKGIPSFSIALVDGDRIVWAEGFGTARTEGNVPVAADTIYRVGSISKLLTDLQVMREVEAGRIDLDAEVSTYLPEFAPRNPFDAPITLRRL
ncbi:MAG TPA: serine hydrolase domain-containing protein, partial [Pirellulaceae bacterium]|nr:serine hydrolase domain-containing protein [Pirellulaceae bacterium]